MSNNIKQEMNRIEIPKELSARSKMGILKAKNEMQIGRKRYNVAGIVVAASLLVSIGTFALINNGFAPNGTTNNQTTPIVTKGGGVKIPAIPLPKGSSEADMIGAIVYNGKIYTQANTEIDAENAKTIMGEKLGKTKGNIDEWSKQDAYAEEFASTIGIEDVYSVKGYDKGFRIMTFGKREGKFYANFYENFNGITINSGEDVFGKLKMAGNVFSAEYRTFSDWDNNVEHYNPIVDMKALNIFVEELNKAKPFPRGGDLEPISISKNNESLREVAIHLKDGTKVKLILLKDGYIYYGNIGAYFKMNEDIFSRLWSQLK